MNLKNILTTSALALAVAGCERTAKPSNQQNFYGTFRGYDTEVVIKSDSQRLIRISRGASSPVIPSSVIGYDINGDKVFEEIFIPSLYTKYGFERLSLSKDRLVSYANQDSLKAAYDSTLVQNARKNKVKIK